MKALVRPHLEYCFQAWRLYLVKDINTIEKVERRATSDVKSRLSRHVFGLETQLTGLGLVS